MNLLPDVRCNNCLPNVISTDENMELSSNLCGIAGLKYRIPKEGFPNLHKNSGLVRRKEVCVCAWEV